MTEFEIYSHARATAVDDVLSRLESRLPDITHDLDIIHEPFVSRRELENFIKQLRTELIQK